MPVDENDYKETTNYKLPYPGQDAPIDTAQDFENLAVEVDNTLKDLVPVGTVLLWAAEDPPNDTYIFCHGQDITSYPELQKILGDNAPDLRGRVAVGKEDSGTFTNLLAKQGADSNSTNLTASNMPAHNHSMKHTHVITHHHNANHGHLEAYNGSGTAYIPYTGAMDYSGGIKYAVGHAAYGQITIAANNFNTGNNSANSAGSSTDDTGNKGSGTAFTTYRTQRSTVLNYIIKARSIS